MVLSVAIQVLTVLVVQTTVWLMPGLTQQSVQFGVRIPADHASAPVVHAARRVFRGGVIAVAALCLPVAVLAAIYRTPFVALLNTLAMIAADWLLFNRARRMVAAAKSGEDWYADLPQAVASDTSLRTSPPRFPLRWVVPSVLVLVATAVAGALRYPHLPATLVLHYDRAGEPDRTVMKTVGTAFLPVFAQFFLTAVVIAVAAGIRRARPDLDVADPTKSAHQYRGYITKMSSALLILATFMNISLAFVAWQEWSGSTAPTLALTGAVAATFAGIAVLVATAVRVGQSGSRLPSTTENPTGLVQRDDDSYWRGGLLYVNRDDPQLLVPKRFGVGWTLNFAHPVAWLALIALVATPIVSAILSAYLH